MLYILLIGGAVNYTAAAVCFFKSRSRCSNWIPAKGRVVELKSGESPNDNAFFPVVKFVNRKGEEQLFSNSMGGTNSYYVGKRVNVLYHPETPEHAVINDFLSMWGIVIIGSAVGTIFFGLAGCVWLWSE